MRLVKYGVPHLVALSIAIILVANGVIAAGTLAPETSEPATAAPGTSAPGTSEPATAAPGTSAPTAEPGTSAPGTSEPATAAPGTSAPGTSSPATSAPGTSAPGTSSPATSAPGTSAPGSSSPGTGVPPMLDTVFLATFNVNPANRPTSVSDFVARLAVALGVPSSELRVTSFDATTGRVSFVFEGSNPSGFAAALAAVPPASIGLTGLAPADPSTPSPTAGSDAAGTNVGLVAALAVCATVLVVLVAAGVVYYIVRRNRRRPTFHNYLNMEDAQMSRQSSKRELARELMGVNQDPNGAQVPEPLPLKEHQSVRGSMRVQQLSASPRSPNRGDSTQPSSPDRARVWDDPSLIASQSSGTML